MEKDQVVAVKAGDLRAITDGIYLLVGEVVRTKAEMNRRSARGAGRLALVPREPTEAMNEAAHAASCGAGEAMGPDFPTVNTRIWSAMLEAAPPAAWPEITDAWIDAYCEMTGRAPDGQQVTFVDGGVVTTFREMAKREIEAMLCAAPKSAVLMVGLAK